MTVDVETLLVKLEARITDFEKKMAQAEKRARTSSSAITSTFTQMNKNLSRAFQLVGVSLGVVAIEHFAQSVIEAGSSVAELSSKMGLSAEEFQKLSFAVSQTQASQDDFVAGFKGMTQFLKLASTGSKEANATLKLLGLSFDDLKKKSPSAVFEILLDRIGKIQNPLQRAAVLQTVMGKSGAALGATSLLGAAGIEEMKNQAVALGAVMSDKTVKTLDEAGDKFSALQLVVTAAGAAFLDPLLPAIEGITSAISDPNFQSGINNFAQKLADVVTFLTAHPELVGILGGAAVGGRVGGLPGAVVGGIVGSGVAGGAAQHLPELGRSALPPSGSQFRPGSTSTSLGSNVPSFDFPNDTSNSSVAAATQKLKALADGGPPAATATNAVADSVQALLDNFPDLLSEFDNLGTAEDDADAKAQKVADDLKFQADQLGRTAREQAKFNALNQAGTDESTAMGRAVARQALATYDLGVATQNIVTVMDGFRDATRDALGTFIQDLRDGKDAATALGDVLVQLGEKLLSSGIDKLVEGLLGKGGITQGGLFSGRILQSALGAFGFGGGRATGGPVSAGKLYRVNENQGQSEYFIPSVSGYVSPRSTTSGGSSKHMVELVLNPEIDARIRRVAGPQSQQISIQTARASNRLSARQQELSG